MGNIFKNKFFIILLIIICVLTLSAIILNLAGYGSAVSDATNIILTPFQSFADILKTSFGGFAAYFTEFNRMKDEIADLKTRLAVAEALNEDTRQLQEENDTLREFFDLKDEHIRWDLQPAKVNARNTGNYQLFLTIDKGGLHNIEKDMPVIAAKPSASGDGKYDYILVGYVSEVGWLYSKVVPFIRTGRYVGAYIKRTSETGNIAGDFTFEKKGWCRLVNLSQDSEIETGDKIYSSGVGGIYPENLYIGEVINVKYDRLSHTKTGVIKPAADFDEIKDVMVILTFEKKFY